MAHRESPLEGLGMTNNFWKGKKVLITGHTGFKGSWLALWLQIKGAVVFGYSLTPPTNPNFFELCKIGSGMTSVIGDIRNIDGLLDCVRKHEPEIIIHMAAQSLVRNSYTYPVETYSTNVMGTVNILETARNFNFIRVIIVVTSDKCYENKEWVWGYRENDAMGGYDPYSSSKGCAELVTAAYSRSYFSGFSGNLQKTGVASVRAGNVIGGGDWGEDRLVPDVIRSIMNGKEVFIRNPNAIRPWQHVLEPLSGYLCLAEKLWHNGEKFSGGWNFGPDIKSCKPVSFLIENAKAFWGNQFLWHDDSGEHLHEAAFLWLDCSKANTLLSWVPKLSLASALDMTFQWYRNYIQEKGLRKFSEQQIELYENLEF